MTQSQRCSCSGSSSIALKNACGLRQQNWTMSNGIVVNDFQILVNDMLKILGLTVSFRQSAYSLQLTRRSFSCDTFKRYSTCWASLRLTPKLSTDCCPLSAFVNDLLMTSFLCRVYCNFIMWKIPRYVLL